MSGRLCRRAFQVIVVVGALTLAGCGSDGAVGTTARDAAVYGAVVADLSDRTSVELADPEDLPVVFIDSFGTDAIPIEVQVEVVTRFIDEYEIRFIDDLEEAIDTDLEGEPVREGSVLIGVGPIVVDGTAGLRGELYLTADDIKAYRYSLVAAGGDVWIIVGDPEEIEPEGFAVSS